MLNKLVLRVFYAAVLLCALAAPLWAQSQAVVNKRTVLGQAQTAYYNLRSEGLSGFECSITPDWNALLADARRQNPDAAATAINLLNQLHFEVRFGPDGSAKITHNELTGQSEEMNKALQRIYGGMEQMTSGFFDIWKTFMLSSPFPETDSEYRLEASGSQYILSYVEAPSTNVVITMGHDAAISKMRVTTKDFDSSIQPRNTRSPRGFLLAGYDATYESGKPEESTVLKVAISYQEVQGLQLPRTLDLAGSYGGSPFSIAVTFSDCSVTRKN